MKPDFQRIQSLLREAVTMLCKNSLPYKQELCVEGLLGITLDKEDIFLVNIKEILKPHEIVDDSSDSRVFSRERSDDSRSVTGVRSSSPVNSDQKERDDGDSSVECSAVSTRAVVPIFKAPSKVQRCHKRAVSGSGELSRHWFASLTHQGSGDTHMPEWGEGTSTPPHNKRRHLTPSYQANSPSQAIDVDSLPVMEVKKEALDDSVTPASMTNYQFHQTSDNFSEPTNYPTVYTGRGESEAKHILPVSLPSIAGLTSSSWHLGSGDVLSTSLPSLPNLSSDMVSAGLPSSLNNSLVRTLYLSYQADMESNTLNNIYMQMQILFDNPNAIEIHKCCLCQNFANTFQKYFKLYTFLIHWYISHHCILFINQHGVKY